MTAPIDAGQASFIPLGLQNMTNIVVKKHQTGDSNLKTHTYTFPFLYFCLPVPLLYISFLFLFVCPFPCMYIHLNRLETGCMSKPIKMYIFVMHNFQKNGQLFGASISSSQNRFIEEG